MKPGIRIMVVNDDEKLRDIVSQTLSDDGHEVTKKRSGEEALDAFRKYPFSLVIADIEMQSMSGIKLLQEVKKLHPDSEVILITNYPAIETAIEALRLEACDYIMDTYDSLDLISSAVNRAVEKIKQTEEHYRLLDMLTKQNKELEQSRIKFTDLAVRDEVTGLYNAHYFHEALAIELNRSSHHHRNVSVVFLDVTWHNSDRSTRGHEEKARLLCTVSQIIKKRLRKSDLLVRYRDETFAILLPETPRDGTQCVIESLRRLLSEHPFQGAEGNITVSMRMAVYPEDGADGTALINNATHC
ncbi:MAG: diguanylate cyclase [Nitrospirae bacterium]|nr:diguanylate cyclase [Nitrospirota bacterium]